MPPEPGGPRDLGDSARSSTRPGYGAWTWTTLSNGNNVISPACCKPRGHPVPLPGLRSLERYSPDPVIATWLALVDTAPPDKDTSMMDLFPGRPCPSA
jgi:hypothetical protein